MKINNNLKITVHIPFFYEEKKKNQLNFFKKVCLEHLNLSTKTKIYVHSNIVLTKLNKRIKFIKHSFEGSHPHKLTWVCRDLMKKQKNQFDIFIYCEDDILFTKKNLKYWLKYKDLCVSQGYNLGFLRVEKNKKNKHLYSADHIEKSKYTIKLDKTNFIIPSSPHCSFWIYDKKEFGEFVKTKYFNFKWKWTGISGVLLIREMASIGWHGINMNGTTMNRYKATIIPFKNKLFNKDSFVRHLPGNYSACPAGLYGSFKVKDLIDEKLEEYEEQSFIANMLNKIRLIIYRMFRFNLKKLIKKFA